MDDGYVLERLSFLRAVNLDKKVVEISADGRDEARARDCSLGLFRAYQGHCSKGSVECSSL